MNVGKKISLSPEFNGKGLVFLHYEKAFTLSLRKLTGTFLARIVGFNREDVTEFIDLIEKTMTKQNYGPHQIYVLGGN